MPKTQRSPVSTPQKLTQAISEPNIVTPSGSGNINSNPRNKRLRSGCSPVNEFLSFKQEFKQEIEEMLTSWYKAHEFKITKLLRQQNALLHKLILEVSE